MRSFSVIEIFAGLRIDDDRYSCDEWIKLIKKLNFQQNAARSRLASPDTKERKKIAEKANLPFFLNESRYKEKTKEIVVSTASKNRSIVGYYIPQTNTSCLGFELRVAGTAATDLFYKILNSPEVTSAFLLYQIYIILGKTIPNVPFFERLFEISKTSVKTMKTLFTVTTEDREIVMFKNALDTIDHVFAQNKSRVNVFVELFGFFLFHRFFPMVEQQQLYDVPSKFAEALKMFVRRADLPIRVYMQSQSASYGAAVQSQLRANMESQKRATKASEQVFEKQLVRDPKFLNTDIKNPSTAPVSYIFGTLLGRLTSDKLSNSYGGSWKKFCFDIQTLSSLLEGVAWKNFSARQADAFASNDCSVFLNETFSIFRQNFESFRKDYVQGKSPTATEAALYFTGIEKNEFWDSLK